MKYKVNIKKTEEESLENIKDTIQDYLKTVDELSKDKETRSLPIC
jgi:hypothetical protein